MATAALAEAPVVVLAEVALLAELRPGPGPGPEVLEVVPQEPERQEPAALEHEQRATFRALRRRRPTGKPS